MPHARIRNEEIDREGLKLRRTQGLPWKRLTVALFTLMAFSPPSEGQTAAPGKWPHPVVARRLTVTGHGEVRIQPDKAEIMIGVVTEDRSSTTASRDNAAAFQKVQTAVMRLEIAPKDIQTIQYSVVPIYSAEPIRPDAVQRPPVITAYRVTNAVRITVHNVSRLGDVVDAATSAGSNQIEGIAFGNSDQTAAEDRALSMAVADARRKADRMALAAGVRIVGVFEMNEGNVQRPGPTMYGRTSMASTPINPGESTVTASVTIVYEMSEMTPTPRAAKGIAFAVSNKNPLHPMRR